MKKKTIFRQKIGFAEPETLLFVKIEIIFGKKLMLVITPAHKFFEFVRF